MDNQILRVDLSSKNISREPVSQELRRRYLGGEGINAYLLWEHFLKVDPRVDPLSPDNVLIAGIGPLGGTGFGAGSKGKFTFKSPAYNIYGDTSCSSAVGAQLRWAGYDHIVITGKAEHPVYLWVNDDEIEIRDARHLWGKDTHETGKIIKEELGDRGVEMACIGQAGENLVRVAAIIVRGHRAAAKGGGGCVFGSKNLKAIVARGTKGLDIYDRDAFIQATNEFLTGLKQDPVTELWKRYGTIRVIEDYYPIGGLLYRNCQGMLPPKDKVNRVNHHQHTNDHLMRSLSSSPGCAVSCDALSYTKGTESPAAQKYAGEWGVRPEFAHANTFGMGCDIPDLPAVIHLTNMCNRYGLDALESGISICFLMELWERGIITKTDTTDWTGEGLLLNWGNYETVDKILEMIAIQKNKLGQILRDGVYQAAKHIGELKGIDVLKYACYGKGHATDDNPVRITPQLSLCAALSPIGAHHLHGMGLWDPRLSDMYLGMPEAGYPFETTLKGAGQAISENLMAITNSLGVCFFLVASRQAEVPLELLARALRAVTGVKLSSEELYTAGRRVANIEKAFNSRLGLGRKDDTLCHRWLNEPQPEGPAKGVKVADYLESCKDEYYEHHGWDKKTSLQTMKVLKELGMVEVAKVLKKDNALAP